ncbi:hypothetical protein Tco_0256226 [Tanacetum coccineum]
MTLENTKNVNALAEAATMVPALHPIDVEHYDASPNIILIASDDDEDYEDDEHAAAPHHNLMNWNWDDVIHPLLKRVEIEKWNVYYDNEDELQSFKHKARQQDKVYEEREESCWILYLRTGIFYPKGREGVMNELPDGAAIFASNYWLRNSDMYRV